MVALAQRVPEFAGYYCEHGDLVVLLTPANSVSHAAIERMIDPKLVSRCFDHSVPQHVPGIVFATAEHSFNSLKQWRDAAVDSVLATPGVVSVGISYKKNRLNISARPEALEKISALPGLKGVPLTAYEVKAGEYARRTGTPCSFTTPGHLYDCFQPVPGGVQFAHLVNGLEVGCTLGVATSRFMGTGWADGWVTASHCLPNKWEMDSVQAFQPNSGSANFIGTEVVDPPGFPCGSSVCRYSDSAWIQAAPTNPYQVPAVGRIAHPDSMFGSSVVDPNYSFFSVRDYAYLAEGMEVHKVGNATGWTYGHVTATCQDRNEFDPPNSIELCQYLADYPTYYGDSGSPVFSLVNSQWDSMAVDIVGINWGIVGGETTAIYSPWDGVITDLGLIASNDADLAAGASVVASSSQESGGWGVAKVVDSVRKSVPNTAAPWSMGYSSAISLTNHEEWVEIDFPSPRTFSKVVLYPRDDAGNVGVFFPVDFKIQVWDGSEWLDREPQTNFQQPDDYPRTFTWGSSDTTNRIRIDATNLRSQRVSYACKLGPCYHYWYAMQFAEIEVYP